MAPAPWGVINTALTSLDRFTIGKGSVPRACSASGSATVQNPNSYNSTAQSITQQHDQQVYGGYQHHGCSYVTQEQARQAGTVQHPAVFALVYGQTDSPMANISICSWARGTAEGKQ